MDPAAVPCKPRGTENGPAGMLPAGPSAIRRCLHQQKQVSPSTQVLGQL